MKTLCALATFGNSLKFFKVSREPYVFSLNRTQLWVRSDCIDGGAQASPNFVSMTESTFQMLVLIPILAGGAENWSSPKGIGSLKIVEAADLP